jgi:hypothetical protein
MEDDRIGKTEKIETSMHPVTQIENSLNRFMIFMPESSPIREKPREIMTQDEKDVADQKSDADKLADLAKIDFLKSLLKTHILTRFRYLIQKYDDPKINELVLKLLVRFSRHSLPVSSEILHTPGLFSILLEKFFTIKMMNSGDRYFGLFSVLVKNLCHVGKSVTETIWLELKNQGFFETFVAMGVKEVIPVMTVLQKFKLRHRAPSKNSTC